MPTNNPKVSAYVPQPIFDRFKDFYEERQLSMSQAVAVILSDYFQLEGQVNHDSDLPSGLLTDRLAALEEKVVSLNSYQSEMIGEVLSEFRNLTSRVSDLEQNLDSNNRISNQLSLLENSYHNDHDDTTKYSEPISELSSNLLSEPVDISLPKVFSGKALALRLNVSQSVLSTHKAKVRRDDFHLWLKEKDSDDIQWLTNHSKGYFFAEDTPSELLDNLLDWWIKNKEKI
jgi:hypothetical protein